MPSFVGFSVSKEKVMEKCPLCETPYQFGPEVYEERKFILDHLKAKGLPVPKPKAEGFLPRE